MILTTERLVLREYTEEDWPAVLAYQQDPRYLRYYDWTGRTAEEARQFVQMFLSQQKAVPRIKFQLAVTLGSTGQLIGSCGIRLESADSRQGDIGYELNPDYWGNGYATEAARAVVKFGFTQLHLHRIWSWCVADNSGSAHVLEKLGMSREGIQREVDYYKEKWWDRLLYAILDDEWRVQQRSEVGQSDRPNSP